MASSRLVADLSSHIATVTEDPNLPLDAKRFGAFDKIYTGKNKSRLPIS